MARLSDAAADEVVAILDSTPDPSLDYRTLAPCSEALGKQLAKYETYLDGCNWSLGISKMLSALDLVVRAAAASFRPVEAALSAAIANVNERSPRNRELCVRSCQHATQKAADAFTAAELSRIQAIIDRAEYRMMRETAQILGLDAGEEWIQKMETLV